MSHGQQIGCRLRWSRCRTYGSRSLVSLAVCCVAVIATALLIPAGNSTVAAPPATSYPGKRLFDAFSKRPEPPKAFITAPVPPPAPPEQPAKPAALRVGAVPPSTAAPTITRVPTLAETMAFASSLQHSAGTIASAALDPTYKPKKTKPVNVKPATVAKAQASPTSSAAPKQPTSKQGTGQQPPQTKQFVRLRKLIADTLATYQRRPLNTAQHTPWEVMHGFIAFGIPSQVRVGGPSGDRVNSIGWMNMGGRCHGQVMLATVGDRLVAMKGIGLQGHSAQYLAILAQCRVAMNSPISIQSKSFTVADLVEEEKLSCKSNTELTFALIGLAHYLPTDSEWKSRDDKTWTLEKLVAEEIEQPIRGAPCGGTHRLFGLAYGCQRRLKATGRLDGHYARADKFVRDYQAFTLAKLQNPDGSFSTEWFKYPADRDDDIDRKVQTTGHILEWLVGSLDQEAIYQPRIVAAVEFLAKSLLREPSREWKIGPMGHALHALTIYQERAWGEVLPGGIAAYHGSMKAAPVPAHIATAPEAETKADKPDGASTRR